MGYSKEYYRDFEALKISEEEVKSIQTYISYAHTGMNVLLDLDPEMLKDLNSKGWNIDLNLSPENIKENMEHLQKIYSAMYKNSKTKPSISSVYRGTTQKEIEKLKRNSEFTRFVSTSNDNEVAKRFTEYEKGALITIKPADDVPYLVMDEFLAETQVSEDEILLAPFCDAGRVTEYYSEEKDGYKKYSISVNKKEFTEVSKDEENNLEKEIFDINLSEELKIYSYLTNEYDSINFQISRLTPEIIREDPDLKAVLLKKRDDLLEELTQVSDKFENAKQSVQKYLQSRFKKIELQIDKEIEKEELANKDKLRKSRIEEYRESKNSLKERVSSVIQNINEIRQIYSTEAKEIEKLKNLASKIGILENDRHENQNISDMIEKLLDNVENIQKEIEEIDINDELSLDMLNVSGEINSKITQKYTQLGNISIILEDCKKDILLEKNDSNQQLVKSIVDIVSKAISQKTICDLTNSKNELQNRKDSLLDKLFGKAKLKQAKIENFDLKIKTIKNGGLNLPDNIEELKEYAQKYSKIIGEENLPEDVKLFLDNVEINTNTKELSPSEREEFETYFNINKPQLVGKKISTKEMLTRVTSENIKLNTQIENSNSRNQKNDTFKKQILKKDTVSNVEEDLKLAISLCKKDIGYYEFEVLRHDIQKEEHNI